MKWRWSLLILVLLGAQALAQEALPGQSGSITQVFLPSDMSAAPQTVVPGWNPKETSKGFLSGNHNFPNFIGFMGNPLQNIDPRAVTAIYPIFGSAWVSTDPPLPSADFQLYGPALTVALSDRLSFGVNQGGVAVAHFNRNQGNLLARLDRQRLSDQFERFLAANFNRNQVVRLTRLDRQRLFDRFDQFRDVEAGGERDGWLNLGGFFQYTLIQDVPDQFLLTAGLRWEAPSGSYEIFQGHGPVHLAPYLTCGKEVGKFHILATTGYEFPAGPGKDTTNLFYANVHFDRRTFGFLYPLIEFNGSYHVKSVDFGLPTRRGFLDFGDFETSGNVLTMAVGGNAVLIREHLEIGAVYTTVLAAQHDLDVNGLLVKMTLRS